MGLFPLLLVLRISICLGHINSVLDKKPQRAYCVGVSSLNVRFSRMEEVAPCLIDNEDFYLPLY